MGLAALLAQGARNSRRIRLTHQTVTIPGLPAPFDGFRLLHLTDLHLRRGSTLPAALAAITAQLQPDLVCFTGDYAFTGLSLPEVDACFARFADTPTLAVLGNADYRDDFTPAVRARWAAALPFLNNRALPITRDGGALWFAGVDDPHHDRDDLPAALRDVPPDAPVVLLAHSPDIITRPLDPRIRLILCGHTHGGQICLPGGRAVVTHLDGHRQCLRGAWRIGPMQGYTSCGAGASSVPLRYFTQSEVTRVTLRCG